MKTNGGSVGAGHTSVIRFMFTRPVFVLPIAHARSPYIMLAAAGANPWVYYIKNGRTPAVPERETAREHQ